MVQQVVTGSATFCHDWLAVTSRRYTTYQTFAVALAVHDSTTWPSPAVAVRFDGAEGSPPLAVTWMAADAEPSPPGLVALTLNSNTCPLGSGPQVARAVVTGMADLVKPLCPA